MICSDCGTPMEPDGYVEDPEDSEDGTDTRWVCMLACGEEDEDA